MNSNSPTHHGDSPTRRAGESLIPRLAESESRQLADSPSRGVVFQLGISPRIRSQKQNGSRGSVRDLWRTNFCKNPRKSASLPCPFKVISDCSLDFLLDVDWLKNAGPDGAVSRRMPRTPGRRRVGTRAPGTTNTDCSSFLYGKTKNILYTS